MAIRGTVIIEKMDELMLDRVRERAENLKGVPSELQTFEMCEDAVTRSPTCIEHVRDPHRTTSLVLLAVRLDARAFGYLRPGEKTLEVCVEYLKHDPTRLSGLSRDPELLRERDRLIDERRSRLERESVAAVRESAHAFYDVDMRYLTEDICAEFLRWDGERIVAVPEHLRTRKVVEAALENTPMEAIAAYVPAGLGVVDRGGRKIGRLAVYGVGKKEEVCRHHVRLEDGRCRLMSGEAIGAMLVERGLWHGHFIETRRWSFDRLCRLLVRLLRCESS